MTYLEKAVNAETLARIDQFRKQRGIRTRKQALETLVLETVTEEHPLSIKLKNAPKAPKGSVSKEIIDQIQQSRLDEVNGKEVWTSFESLKTRVELRRQRERAS